MRTPTTHDHEAKLGKMAWLLGLYLLLLAYAVARYHWGKGLGWEHFPLHVQNKAVSWLSALSLALAVGPLAPRGGRSFWGGAGFWLAGGHVLLALLGFAGGYFGSWFTASGILGARQAWTLLLGAGAWLLLAAVFAATLSERWAARFPGWPRAARWALALVAAHSLLLGWPNWLDWRAWPLGLPPISMLACAAALYGLWPWPRRQ